jgi:hypothetical protein
MAGFKGDEKLVCIFSYYMKQQQKQQQQQQ